MEPPVVLKSVGMLDTPGIRVIMPILQRCFLNLVGLWPEIASRKARPQSCQAHGQVAMKRCSRPFLAIRHCNARGRPKKRSLTRRRLTDGSGKSGISIWACQLPLERCESINEFRRFECPIASADIDLYQHSCLHKAGNSQVCCVSGGDKVGHWGGQSLTHGGCKLERPPPP